MCTLMSLCLYGYVAHKGRCQRRLEALDPWSWSGRWPSAVDGNSAWVLCKNVWALNHRVTSPVPLLILGILILLAYVSLGECMWVWECVYMCTLSSKTHCVKSVLSTFRWALLIKLKLLGFRDKCLNPWALSPALKCYFIKQQISTFFIYFRNKHVLLLLICKNMLFFLIYTTNWTNISVFFPKSWNFFGIQSCGLH